MPHLIVINDGKIHNSYGSQGLFDEIPFFEEDFNPFLMYYNLRIYNSNFTARKITVEGTYIGIVPAGKSVVFKLKRRYYGLVVSEQVNGYLLFPKTEMKRINKRPDANEEIYIKF